MSSNGIRRTVWLGPVLAALGCAGEVSLDAGPPPRPAFQEVEGLKWGMTPEEVRAAWGPGRDGEVYSYDNRGGYPAVSLGFNSIPASMIVHKDLKRAAGDGTPGRFLVWVSFQGDTSLTKQKVRADLVARFGQPLTDAKLLRVHHCEAPKCEIFRAAECTVVTVTWNPAFADLNWPEHLSSLTYRIAPDGLVVYVPRTEWPKLRGSVPASFPKETKARFDGLKSGSEGATPAEIVKAVGRPNLLLDEAPGKAKLYYLFLDDSIQILSLEGGRLQGSEGAWSTN